MRSLLVTNDFPPKIGGIQSYLGELWRRMPGDETVVYAPRFDGDRAWDDDQPWPVVRSSSSVMLGAGRLAARVAALADEVRADVVLADPVIMVGPAMIHRRFRTRPDGRPRLWAPILHGAEITVPGRLPLSHSVMKAVLKQAPFVISAGGYPLAEAERIVGRSLDAILVPPGVDTQRFVPIDEARRAQIRAAHGISADDRWILGLSRLVPRKGFDVLIEAAHRIASIRSDVVIGIGGGGRDLDRLQRLASKGDGRVTFLGRVPEEDLAATYGAADVFAMLCRNRWMNFEQEGFGIVFLEAQAAAIPAIAGRSGGSHEAVAHGETGLIVDDPQDVEQVVEAVLALVADDERRLRMGAAGRQRAIAQFDYDALAAGLREQLAEKVIQYSP